MTYQQKDDFVKKLERTALLTIVASVCSAIVLSVGMFFYMKFQTDVNTESIKELRLQKADMNYVLQFKERNDIDHNDLKKGIQDLKVGQDRIFNFLLEHK
jgi:hypothetical protein